MRDMFDGEWKINPFKDRGLKFFLKPSQAQELTLKDFLGISKKAIHRLSQVIHKNLSNGLLTVDDIKSRNSKIATKIWHSDNEFLEKEFGLKAARQKRGATFIALRLYRGYEKRNSTLPPTPPRPRSNNAIYLEEGVIKHIDGTSMDNGAFSIKVHGIVDGKPKVEEILYTIPKGMFYKKPYLADPPGGNITYKNNQWYFVARTRIPIKWQYEPLAALGFDLNKTPSWFIALSEQIMYNGIMTDRLGHSKKIEKLTKKLVALNKEIKDKDPATKLKSSQRRAVRRKVQAAHKKLEKECMVYVNDILDHVINNKLLLCIDPLSCGARHGTFGHEKVWKILTKLCEDRGVPFVHVPTPHTSKCCYQCMTECDRPRVDKLVCPNCGELPAHTNASSNIKNWGWRIWGDGMASFNKWKKENFKRKNSLPTVGV